ncbi:MAG: DUF4919 domain-containing protein [Bacteroidota bacterium]
MFLRFFISVATVFILFSAYGQNQNADDPPPFIYKRDFKHNLDSASDRTGRLYYQKLIIKFLNNDSSLTNAEMLTLMIGFTGNPHYKPLENMEKELEIFDHNNNGEFSAAISKSRNYLQTNPLSLLVLREISYAYQKNSKEFQKNLVMDSALLYQDSAKYFMDLNDRMMEAMIYSGKGRTPETPIFSLGIADGEYFIPNVGFVMDKKDTEWNKNGDFVETITAIVDKVNVRKYYFVIQHAKKKIDDDAANELQIKKAKQTEKKKGKEKEKGKGKKINAVTDSTSNMMDSIPMSKNIEQANQDSLSHEKSPMLPPIKDTIPKITDSIAPKREN